MSPRGERIAELRRFDFLTAAEAEELDELEEAEYESDDSCLDPGGHSWVYTGTAYGGDDERYFGEGVCYCEHCGADGDG